MSRHLVAIMDVFRLFDKDGDGKVGGEEAYSLLVYGVSPELLRIAWANADREQRGYLTPEQFAVFTRLVAAAQKGGTIDFFTLDTPWFQK